MYRKSQRPMSRLARVAAALVAVMLAAMPARADTALSTYRMLVQPAGGGGTAAPPFPPPPTLAAVVGKARPVTLPDLLQVAMRQSPSLQRAEIDIDVAEALIEQARAYKDWNVGADVSASTGKFVLGFGTNRFEQTRTNVTGTATLSRLLPDGGTVALHGESSYERQSSDEGTIITYTDSVTAALTEPLLRGRGGWLLRSAERRASLARTAEVLARRQTAIDIVRDVVNGYWDLVFALRDLEIRHSSLELAQERLRRTQAAIKGGGIAATEALAVEQVIAARQEEILGAELTVLNQSITLRRLVGMNIDPGDLALVTETDLGAPTGTYDLDALLDGAYRTSPVLAQLEQQGKSAEIEVDVTENGLLPQLDLSLAIGPLGVDDNAAGAARNMVQFDGITGTATLTFSQSIGRRAVKGQVRQARAERLRVKINAFDARAQIAQALSGAVILAESARQRIEIAGKAISLAEQNIVAEQSRFGLGKSTNFDVLQRQDELKQAQLRQARAIVDWHKAAAVISAISGDLLERYGITLAE